MSAATKNLTVPGRRANVICQGGQVGRVYADDALANELLAREL
jgi:hypothetical protein